MHGRKHPNGWSLSGLTVWDTQFSFVNTPRNFIAHVNLPTKRLASQDDALGVLSSLGQLISMLQLRRVEDPTQGSGRPQATEETLAFSPTDTSSQYSTGQEYNQKASAWQATPAPAPPTHLALPAPAPPVLLNRNLPFTTLPCPFADSCAGCNKTTVAYNQCRRISRSS